MSQNQMFCYQCEQTAKGQGCTVAGVCGKTSDVAALQDLLVYMLQRAGATINRSQNCRNKGRRN